MPDAKGESGPFLAGVILAAGASTRMGQPKQLLAYRGRPLLQRVVDAALASSLDEVVVVLGHRAEEVRAALELPPDDRIRLVVNPDYAAGQSTSLRCGLRSASPSATGAAVLLGDQPHVTAALIDRIAQAFRSADRPIVRPVYETGSRCIPGHPVFLARRVWPEIERLRDDQGARDLFAAHRDWLLEVPLAGEPPADVDTWEDYQRVAGEPQRERAGK